MDTILINSKDRVTSDPNRLLHDLTDKINLKSEVINMFLYQTQAVNLVNLSLEKYKKATQK